MTKQYNNLKDYIIAYQNGNNTEKERVIADLIRPKFVLIDGDYIQHLQFADSKLNEFLYNVLDNYSNNIAREDIEAMVMQFLFDVDKNGDATGMFTQIDTSYDPAQIISWLSQRFWGYIEDNRHKELLFNETVISEDLTTDDNNDTDYAFNDDSYSLYEQASYQDYIEREYSTSYSKFIKEIGGLENILTDRQLEVVTMSNIASQRAVADKLGITEASVSRTLTQADKRLKKSYLSWRTAEIMSSKNDTDTVDTIKAFLHQFNQIADVDVTDSFDYFTYTVNWIKQNSSSKDFEIDYAYMQKNKLDISLNVVDVISDYIMRSQYKLVTDVLDAYVRELDVDKSFTKRQRERFVNAIVGAFYKYLEDVEDNINEFLNVAVDSLAIKNNEGLGRVKNDDYDGLIELIK